MRNISAILSISKHVAQVRRLEHALRAAPVAELDLASWRPSGSAQLVRSLLAPKLIDRYVLLIHPLVLGQGHRLFDERGPGVDFGLADSVVTPKGVIIATYQPR